MNNKKILILLLALLSLVTGCGKKKEKNYSIDDNKEKMVIKNQIFEGLEFVNVGINEKSITTTIINNTGVTYEGSKFSIKVFDKEGKIILQLEDKVTESIEAGTTKTIKTKTKENLKEAVAIEYSILFD